jgi:hypothetical protein
MRASRRNFLGKLLAAPLFTMPWANGFQVFSSVSPGFIGDEFIGNEDLEARLAADPLRPQCHLLPAKNLDERSERAKAEFSAAGGPDAWRCRACSH